MTEDDGRDYLADAVDRLARVRKVRKETSRGTGIVCVGEYERPPLLEELRLAKAGNTGAHAGASMKAKIPLNADAADLYGVIEAQVYEWCDGLRLRHDDGLEASLIRWFVWFTAYRGHPTYVEEGERVATRVLESWARRIEGLFNPLRTIELTRPGQQVVVDHRGAPVLRKPGHPPAAFLMRDAMVPEACPVCGQQYGLLPRTGDRVTALVIEYRTDHEDAVEDVIARCRSCETVWKGYRGVRALRWDLDHPGEQPAELELARAGA